MTTKELQALDRLMSERDHLTMVGDGEMRRRVHLNLADAVPGLVAEVRRLNPQISEARKLLIEFTTDPAVCQAIASRCIGGHQEEPCKCLYCRARHQLFQMDEVVEKQEGRLPNNDDGIMG